MMKDKLFVSIILITFSFFFTSNAFGAWSFNITTDYINDDPKATFTVNLSTDEELKIPGGYTFGFKFDQNELEFASFTNTPLDGFPNTTPAFGEPTTFDQENGIISNFTAWGFSTVIVTPGEYNLGTITFNVIENASIMDGETDFNFNYNDDQHSYLINGVGYTADATKSLPHLTDVGSPVPVPSAIFLLGTGLLGLAGFRRK